MPQNDAEAAKLQASRLEGNFSPGWFERTLALPGDLVTRIDAEPLDGLSSRVFRIRLSYPAGAGHSMPRSVVVKLPLPGSDGSQTGSPHERERHFYRELALVCGVPVPKLLRAVPSPVSGGYALILEDYPQHTPGAAWPSVGQAQALLVVEHIARLHARWWASKELEGYTFLRTMDEFVDRVAAALPLATPRFFDRFDDLLDAGDRACIEHLSTQFRGIALPLKQTPGTLVHQDLCLRNLLFGGPAHPPPLVFIDWQLAQRNAGVRDLSYFIGTSVDRSHEGTLIASYHDRLREYGISDYSFSSLEQDYARSVLCDLARIVMTGGQQSILPAMEKVVAEQLQNRRGSPSMLGLNALLD